MKKYTIILTVMAVSQMVFGQTNFENAIADGLKKFEGSKSLDEMKIAADHFDRIAVAEPEEWLPLYYSSMIHCILAFSKQDAESKQKESDFALEKVEQALKLEDKESEIYALKGMVYQAIITIDPMNNGQAYSAKASGSFEMAKKLDPTNPRPYYLQAVSVLYTPAEFGGGKKAALPMLEKAMQLFNTFEPQSDIYPHWGKDDCQKQLLTCKETEE